MLKFENGIVKIIINSNDSKTNNTKKLLEKIYNGVDSTSKSHIYRREEISKEVERFAKILSKYLKNRELFEDEIIERLSKKTKSESSAYVSFKRQIIRENHKELEKFFD